MALQKRIVKGQVEFPMALDGTVNTTAHVELRIQFYDDATPDAVLSENIHRLTFDIDSTEQSQIAAIASSIVIPSDL